MSYLKNTAGQYLYLAMIAAADGSALTSGTVNGYRSIDGGAQAAVTGTISHKGNGQWELALSQADTNGDEIGFLFTHASGIPVSITIVTDTKKVGGLQDLSAAAVNAEVDTALADYDAPTKAELDAGLAALNDLDATAVQSAAAAALTAYDPPTKAELDAGLAALNDPDAAAIADAVWDEALAGHAAAGSTGEALAGAGSAGDPWTTTLPGAYTGSQAGKILADVLADTNELQTDDVPGLIASLNDLDGTAVQSAAAAALTAYDPPTKTELDSGLAALNDLDSTAVQSAAAAALTAYDPPTKAELDTGLAGLNDPTAGEIADAVWDEAKAVHVAAGSFGEEVQAHALSSEIGALNDLDSTAVQTAAAAALTAYDPPTKAELDAGLAALNDLDAAAVQSAAAAALTAYDPPTKAEMDSAFTALNDFNPATEQVNANVVQISGDGPAADNLESMLDGTGGGQLSLGRLQIIGSHAAGTVFIQNTNANGTGIIVVGQGLGAAVNLDGGHEGIYITGQTAIRAQGDNIGLWASGTTDIAGDLNGTIAGFTAGAAEAIANAVWDAVMASHLTAGSTGEALDNAGAAGAPPTAVAIADEVLKRGVANVEDTADPASLAAIILATLESSIAGSTWTIRKTGGATFITKTVTTDPAAEPITGVT